MAKKRKVVRRKATKRIQAIRQRGAVMPSKTSFATVQAAKILSLTGGIITLLAGLLAVVFGAILTFFAAGIGAVFALPNILAGIAMLVIAGTIKTKPQTSAIVLLIAGIVALITPPFGFIVGPVLSLIGALVVLIRRA